MNNSSGGKHYLDRSSTQDSLFAQWFNFMQVQGDGLLRLDPLRPVTVPISVFEVLELFEKTDKVGRKLIKKMIKGLPFETSISMSSSDTLCLEIAAIPRRQVATKILPYLVDNSNDVRKFAKQRLEVSTLVKNKKGMQ